MHSTYLLGRLLKQAIISIGHRDVVISLIMALDLLAEESAATPEAVSTRLRLEKMVTELYGLTK